MLPEAFLERMQGMLGEEYEEFLESFQREQYHALRLNALKKGLDGRSAAELFGVQESCGLPEGDHGEASGAGNAWRFELSRVPWAENGYYYGAGHQPGRHPFHAAGVYYIQEPSAMAPVELLGVQPGERVLDLCAAPGGKSTQIAAKLKGRGFLLCNEIHPARAKVLSENIERMGVVNACVTNETPAHLAEVFPMYFHRILVDAPCSGEGMFRKNSEACEEWSPENVHMCAARQDEILDCAAEMLCPGGRLVYSTCTFAPEEDEGSVSRFLQRHPEFELLPADSMEREKERLGLKGCDGVSAYAEIPVSGLEGTLRMAPHRIKGEGHFAAVLQKKGSLPEGVRRSAAGGHVKGIAEKELGEFPQFCRENLRYGGWAAPCGCSTAEKEPGLGSGMPAEKEPGLGSGMSAEEEPGLESGMSAEKEPGLGSVLSAEQPEGGPAMSVMELLEAAAGGVPGAPRYIRFGENIYLVPADMPGLKGLKVLRPGLHLGGLKKNRFEPSHALALAISPREAVHLWNMKADSPEAAAYLSGQTFPAEGEKGWYLICVDGFGIGWGKLAGGIMKNHYPRGLRVQGANTVLRN